MVQRIVVWELPEQLNPRRKNNNPASLDLTPEALARVSPELAAALKGGRIISHSFAVSHVSNLVISFVVEFGDGEHGVGAGQRAR